MSKTERERENLTIDRRVTSKEKKKSSSRINKSTHMFRCASSPFTQEDSTTFLARFLASISV